jgi:hypothetical protein
MLITFRGRFIVFADLLAFCDWKNGVSKKRAWTSMPRFLKSVEASILSRPPEKMDKAFIL